MVVATVCAVTIAAWMGVRVRRPLVAVMVSWALWLALCGLPLAISVVGGFLVFQLDFLRSENLRVDEEGARLWKVIVRWELLSQFGTAYVLPLAWLGYWWRWARRDFAREYLE